MRRVAGRRAVAAVAMAALLGGCTLSRWTPHLAPPDELPASGSAGTLKVHLQSGDVVLLTEWREDVAARRLEGVGRHYDLRRDLVADGTISIPADSVALVEGQARDPATLFGLSLFSVYATLATAFTVACVADPKSCFGSCPTFYLEGDEGYWPQAEGFSRSVARALEERDIDALYHAQPTGSRFTITMRNEALETHAVRGVELLAATRPVDGRVFATREGVFYPASRITSPVRCHSDAGDCLGDVLSMDGRGRITATDSTDLGVREVFEVEFPASGASRVGLVIGARHTFVSTYVFYQTLAYLGSEAGSWLARLERGDLSDLPPLFDSLHRLGEIRVSMADDDGLRQEVGVYDEAGPLATDVQVIPFEVDPHHPVRLRFDLGRGFWRVDYLALAVLDEPVVPLELAPVGIRRDGSVDPEARAALLDPTHHLFTYPGSTFELEFELPDTPRDLELFLRSEGYYYEWMRQEWLAEEDPLRALHVLFDPESAFRDMAPAFKRLEAEMEEMFWESRVRR